MMGQSCTREEAKLEFTKTFKLPFYDEPYKNENEVEKIHTVQCVVRFFFLRL